MMLKKIKRAICLTLLLLGFFAGCEENRLNDIVDDALYLAKSGVQQVTVFNWGQDTLEVHVVKSGVGLQTARLRIEVAPDLLPTYNQRYNANYELLPEALYTIPKSDIDIPANAYKGRFEILLDVPEYAKRVVAGARYALPCRVLVVGGEVQLAENALMEVVFIPSVAQPAIGFEFPGIMGSPLQLVKEVVGDFWFYSKVKTNYVSPNDLPFKIRVDEDYVHRYNQQNGTALVPFPAGALSFNSDEFVVPVGGTMKQVSFRIDKTKLVGPDGRPAPPGVYWMPLEITEVDRFGIDAARQMQIFQVVYSN